MSWFFFSDTLEEFLGNLTVGCVVFVFVFEKWPFGWLVMADVGLNFLCVFSFFVVLRLDSQLLVALRDFLVLLCKTMLGCMITTIESREVFDMGICPVV
jgi:hypothetical protein